MRGHAWECREAAEKRPQAVRADVVLQQLMLKVLPRFPDAAQVTILQAWMDEN